MKVKFNTALYKVTHGHEPQGLGSWSFRFGTAEYMVEGLYHGAMRVCYSCVVRDRPDVLQFKSVSVMVLP